MQTLEEIAKATARGLCNPACETMRSGCRCYEDILAALRAERAAERERCAKVAEGQAKEFLSPQYAAGQPLSSFAERFACAEVAAAIRNQP